MFKSIKAFVLRTIEYNFAPFAVYSPAFGKTHYSWTMQDALEWLDCYPETFGRVLLLGFNREIIKVVG